MRRGVESAFLAIRWGAEILLSLSAFIISYYAAGEAGGGAPELFAPKTMLLLLISSLIYSVVLEYCRSGARSRRFFANASVASLFYFGISASTTLIFGKEGRVLFLLRWTLFSAILTALLTLIKEGVEALLLRPTARTRRRAIIFGDSRESVEIFLKRSGSGDFVIGAVGEALFGIGGVRYLGGEEDFGRIVREYRPCAVVFALNAPKSRHLSRLMRIADDNCARCYLLPELCGCFRSESQLEFWGEELLLNLRSTPLDNPYARLAKRSLDTVGAALLISITLPLMLAVAIGVRVSLGRPIIFRQRRVGAMGKEFTMLKFRSMRPGDDGWSTGICERKTRFGNLIRRTSLDELPQLFNVLAGEMSLVGPRPEIPKFVNSFRRRIPLYMVKHYVKPGITGLAQIKGLRGDTSVSERIEADIFYIENWSLTLDLKILAKTPFKIINKQEKYAAEGKSREG